MDQSKAVLTVHSCLHLMSWDAVKMPPGTSKQAKVRYLDIHEGDPLDEAQFKDWVKQASQLPG